MRRFGSVGARLFIAQVAPPGANSKGDFDSVMVTQLHHVNVTVPAEIEAATKKFYGSVLGLEQVPKPAAARQSGAWYQIAATQLHLSLADQQPVPLSSPPLSFAVSTPL